MNTFSPDELAACQWLVEIAVDEDLGTDGDRTAVPLIPADQPGRASFVARPAGVVAGLDAIGLVAARIDPSLQWSCLVPDGASVAAGTTIASLRGPLRSILAVERTALNFVQRLSGIATLTREYATAVEWTNAKVLDTRKTTPGWRLLEKYAVRMGGGTNHRIGLYDGILIKDNHIAGLGDPATALVRAVRMAREHPGNEGLPIEIEVDTLAQLEQVLPERPDIVLLDNMPVPRLLDAVRMRDAVSPATQLEASGGVTLTTIRAIAETGVERISVGALTHSAKALDIGLDYEG